MNLKSSNKIETNRYEIEVEVGAEEFEAALAKVFKRESKNIQVPGFRKGKAPRSFIEKRYGKEVFFEDAINELLPEAFEAAVKETGLDVINDDPAIEIVSVSAEEGFLFKGKLTVKPEIEIKGYDALEIEEVDKEVTDADVDAEIERVRNRNARLITVEDRNAEMGDTAVIDFEGFVDGVAFDGGKGEGHSLELGSHMFIEGFEEQVAGHAIGEEFEINVKFPEDYQAEELQGKDAMFKIKIHELKKKELPELDDEFAKDVSDFDTLDEYKADIRAKLTENKERNAEQLIDNRMAEELVKLVEGEIPEAMYANQTEESLREYAYRLSSQGMDLKTYEKYTGMNEDAIRAMLRPQAEQQVKVKLALEKIAQIEKLEATEEEIDAQFEKLAEMYGMEADKLKEILPRDEIKNDLAMDKAVKLVREKVTFVAKKDEE